MQTYSREFLQGLPEKRKQQEFDTMIQNPIQIVNQIAQGGQTSYFFDMTNMRKISPSDINQRQFLGNGQATTMTNEEIVTRFQQKFPDCSVKYGEEWVESNASTKVLKRGVTIDWS